MLLLKCSDFLFLKNIFDSVMSYDETCTITNNFYLHYKTLYIILVLLRNLVNIYPYQHGMYVPPSPRLFGWLVVDNWYTKYKFPPPHPSADLLYSQGEQNKVIF